MSAIRVAISGKSGCGNTTVSRLLAETLQVKLINYTFRIMAEEEGVPFETMRRMAEEDDRWDRLLDQRQVDRAREGSCVLASRLAIWLLEDADLKVYLRASREVRATRINEREGAGYEETLRATEARDEDDRARYKRIYDIDIDSWDFADLVVDTERYLPAEIVEIIQAELQKKGTVRKPQ
ncbi:MAG: cytidylate kinase [Spirochaetaceae bacterium]|nr:MAG: cytidylate kinase [Spirochaetaceae bacterium]